MTDNPADSKQPRREKNGRFPKSTTPASGMGWGGPAKCAREARPAAAPFEAGNTIHELATPEIRRAAWKDREEALALYRLHMRDSNQGGLVRLAAAEKLLDRTEGKAVARAEISGPNGSPLQTETIDRPPAETREQWIARRQRELDVARRVLESPAGSAD